MTEQYIRDDGVLMVETAPGEFVRARYTPPRGPTLIEERVFAYLVEAGQSGHIADECVLLCEAGDQEGRPWVNLVAPIFTKFRKLGIICARGDRRLTRWGKAAKVWVLSPDAHELFRKMCE